MSLRKAVRREPSEKYSLILESTIAHIRVNNCGLATWRAKQVIRSFWWKFSRKEVVPWLNSRIRSQQKNKSAIMSGGHLPVNF